MIKSMTGFGRYEVLLDKKKYIVELKSVNHRYLDVNIKMPKKLNALEHAIRAELKKYAERGKIDIFITLEDLSDTNVRLAYNSQIAGEYVDIFKKMSEEFAIKNDIGVSALSKYPEVISMEEVSVDEEELFNELVLALRGAFEEFVASRIREGENLKKDLLSKLDNMLRLITFIEEHSPQIVAEYREKLMTKVNDLLMDTKIDEARLLMEVTIFADKSCVDEEIVRLKSHIETTRNILLEGGAIGRKLDFIAQEMNREANTTLSKSNNLEISNCAIEIKTEIEKVREQIQNIE